MKFQNKSTTSPGLLSQYTEVSRIRKDRKEVPLNWVAAARLCLALTILAMPVLHVSGAASEPETPIPSPILDPWSVSWYSVRDMTGDQFKVYFEEKSAAGFMVIDIEVDQVDGVERVGAAWQKNLDGRDWVELRNMTESEFAIQQDDMVRNNFRMIDQEVYFLGSTLYLAGVWIKNVESLQWASYYDKTDGEFSDLFDIYEADGFMMIDLEATIVDGKPLYAAVWVKNSESLDWQEWRDMTSAEFTQKFEELEDRYFMVDVESYLIGENQYYAGIWVENASGRFWYEYRDMTAKQFGDTWLMLRDAGYRLIDYETYPTATGRRYAGIWRQNGDRPNWELKDKVTDYFEQQMTDFDIPGMSVAIALDGNIIYLKGFGFADIDDQVIAHSGTIYRTASVAKAIAGVLSMDLEEQGLIDLSDNSSDYISGLPAFHTHSVQQTIANRSGIGHYDEYPSIVDEYTTAYEAVQQLWNVPLALPPGTNFFYSTHAYTFLGASIEGAVGQPIEETFNVDFSEAYDLDTLRVEDRSVPNPYRSTLYNGNNDEVSADDLSWKILGGGLESSPYDLMRMGLKMIDGVILTPASLTTLWTPPDGSSSYALGWYTGNEAGTPVVAIDGNQNGSRTYIRMYPDLGIVVAIMTNRDPGGHDPIQMGRDIGAMMLAAEGLPISPADAGLWGNTSPSAVLEEEVSEPGEEGQDPALVVYPAHEPVANPSEEDLEED